MGIPTEHLIALSDEIAALSRAGVPLEKGLASVRRDFPRDLATITDNLVERMNRGESLSDALSAGREGFPTVFSAVVAAGLKSGRPSGALEALANTARRMEEMRRLIGLACWYPIIVLLVAYGLFVLFTIRVAPALVDGFESFQLTSPGAVDALARAGNQATIWAPLFPMALVLASITWWYLAGRARMVEYGPAMLVLGWVPRVRRMVRYSQAAILAEVSGLLVRQEVPLGEALRLSAAATGNPRLCANANELANQIEQGKMPPEASAGSTDLPPLLRWLMFSGYRHGALADALDHAGEDYRERALHEVDVVRTFLPVLLTLTIGGAATLLFALTTMLPFSQMLRGLAEQAGILV